MLACVVDTCLDAACVCDFFWACAGVGVGLSLCSVWPQPSEQVLTSVSI